MKGRLSKMLRAEQWADRICAQLGKSVESIVLTGRLLLQAKADLVHGEWGRLFDDELISISHRTANFYMAVAHNAELSNPKNFSILPATVSTLYQLTQAEPSKLKNALKDGVITPDMPRKAVKALLPAGRHPSTTNRQKPRLVKDDFSPAIQCFFDMEARIRSTVFELDADDRADLIERIRQLLNNIESEAIRQTA